MASWITNTTGACYCWLCQGMSLLIPFVSQSQSANLLHHPFLMNSFVGRICKMSIPSVLPLSYLMFKLCCRFTTCLKMHLVPSTTSCFQVAKSEMSVSSLMMATTVWFWCLQEDSCICSPWMLTVVLLMGLFTLLTQFPLNILICKTPMDKWLEEECLCTTHTSCS